MKRKSRDLEKRPELGATAGTRRIRRERGAKAGRGLLRLQITDSGREEIYREER